MHMTVYWGAFFIQLIGILISLFILVLVVILMFKGITALNIYIAKNKKDTKSN